MTSNENIGSNTEMEDLNRVYTKNPQEKEDLIEATSKVIDQKWIDPFGKLINQLSKLIN